MMDVSTDPTLVSAQLGGHVEILEIDDLRVRVEQVTEEEANDRMALAASIFTVDDSVVQDDFRWGATVSVALDRLVEDFSTAWPTTTAVWTGRPTRGLEPA